MRGYGVMKKCILFTVYIGALLACIPGWVWAGGEKAQEIVVVADTRNLRGFNLYIAGLYNENMWLFATWAVLLTTALGVLLGLLMDFLMTRTGLDLGKTSKKEQ